VCHEPGHRAVREHLCAEAPSPCPWSGPGSLPGAARRGPALPAASPGGCRTTHRNRCPLVSSPRATCRVCSAPSRPILTKHRKTTLVLGYASSHVRHSCRFTTTYPLLTSSGATGLDVRGACRGQSRWRRRRAAQRAEGVNDRETLVTTRRTRALLRDPRNRCWRFQFGGSGSDWWRKGVLRDPRIAVGDSVRWVHLRLVVREREVVVERGACCVSSWVGLHFRQLNQRCPLPPAFGPFPTNQCIYG
jgi:hypothetical protein